jgi:hypothetical protein
MADHRPCFINFRKKATLARRLAASLQPAERIFGSGAIDIASPHVVYEQFVRIRGSTTRRDWHV